MDTINILLDYENDTLIKHAIHLYTQNWPKTLEHYCDRYGEWTSYDW
jgi:hypothetical protein